MRGSLTALGVGAAVASLEGLSAMTALEELHLEGGLDRDLGRRRGVLVLTANDAMPQLGKIVRAGTPGRFAGPIDLRERFGVDNNAQASDALQAWLKRHQPSLCDCYELDSESSAVWLYANAEADLERLIDLLRCG